MISIKTNQFYKPDEEDVEGKTVCLKNVFI